jgi:tellurium resistance protein TerD
VNIEVCENCGCQIGKLESACVYQNKIVCEKCDGKLRNIPVDNILPNVPTYNNSKSDQIRCPKCNSSQIMGGQRGFSGGKSVGFGLLLGPVGFLAGLHGSKKIVVSCLNCGHKWEP